MKKLLKSILKLLVPRSIQNKIHAIFASLDKIQNLEGQLNTTLLLAGENKNEYRGNISHLYRLFWYRAQKYAAEDKYPEILADWYREHTGRELDLENPRTFDEKIQWLKLYDSTPLKTRLSDKLLVRDWVKEKIGETYLIPLLGAWDSFDEIDFDALPNQFVLKANHGSGWNIIVKDKSTFDRAAAKQSRDDWLKINFAFWFGLELQYCDIKPKIIAEQYMEDENGELLDYKFYCFGKAYFIQFLYNRFGTEGYKCVMYDLNWSPTGWTPEGLHRNGDSSTPQPLHLDVMVNLANTLCSDFSYVRVDFYCVRGKIYFGEFTFTPMSGVHTFEPEEWNLKLGDLIRLPVKK